MSFNPGIELVLEAFDGYWRKTPSVKRIVMKSIPDELTRLAALKTRRGRYRLFDPRRAGAGPAEDSRAQPAEPGRLQATNWIYFPDQCDPKSPWHDVRVRQAANLAIDRDGMNKALFLGYCKITNSIIPYEFEYYWQPPSGHVRSGQGQEAVGRGRLS